MITYTYTGTSTTPATTTTSYVETDHLATPRLITNAARQKRWTWESAPYGDTFPSENPQALGAYKYNLRFPGQYFDAETNHHYNHHRDYESTSGRYVQSDPIGLAGGINAYGYALSQPTKYVDPTGKFVIILPFIPAISVGLADIGIGIGIGVGLIGVDNLLRDRWDRRDSQPPPLPPDLSRSGNLPDGAADRNHCLRLYERCTQEGWGGDWSCGQCHFYCTGINKVWPFEHCSPDLCKR